MNVKPVTKHMTKQFVTFLFFACTLLSCDKNNLSYSGDPNYPTVIQKLNSATHSELKTAYAKKYKYFISTINEYGFCSYYDDVFTPVDNPPLLNPLTQTEATELIKSFVSQNPTITGVKNSADLKLTLSYSDTGFWDNSTYWNVRSANQFIDTIEVLNTQIMFEIKNRELRSCVGNWYPTIYIPGKFNLDRDQAKSSLLNKVVWHSTIAGVPYSATITTASLAASTTRLVVVPYTINNQIELRVTWQINIPGPVYYLINVDVMTGEIISEQPTIIS